MSSEIENLSASFGLVAPRAQRLRRLTVNRDRKVARLQMAWRTAPQAAMAPRLSARRWRRFPRSELDFRRLTVANRQQPPGNRSPRRGLRRHFLLARPDEITRPGSGTMGEALSQREFFRRRTPMLNSPPAQVAILKLRLKRSQNRSLHVPILAIAGGILELARRRCAVPLRAHCKPELAKG